MHTNQVTISLTEKLKAFVEGRVTQGGFATPSAYIEAVLEDALNREANDRLEALLIEGLDGEGTRVTKEWWRNFRADLVERHGRKNGP